MALAIEGQHTPVSNLVGIGRTPGALCHATKEKRPSNRTTCVRPDVALTL
jgi:hypothetical protein